MKQRMWISDRKAYKNKQLFGKANIKLNSEQTIVSGVG